MYDDLDMAIPFKEALARLENKRVKSTRPLIPPQILRLFSPDLGPADVLTGGQFFAALRLVSHVLSGKEMDPSLVFIQGVLSNASYTSLSRFVKCSTTQGISYCAM